jgi:hypothetical protein
MATLNMIFLAVGKKANEMLPDLIIPYEDEYIESVYMGVEEFPGGEKLFRRLNIIPITGFGDFFYKGAVPRLPQGVIFNACSGGTEYFEVMLSRSAAVILFIDPSEDQENMILKELLTHVQEHHLLSIVLLQHSVPELAAKVLPLTRGMVNSTISIEAEICTDEAGIETARADKAAGNIAAALAIKDFLRLFVELGMLGLNIADIRDTLKQVGCLVTIAGECERSAAAVMQRISTCMDLCQTSSGARHRDKETGILMIVTAPEDTRISKIGVIVERIFSYINNHKEMDFQYEIYYNKLISETRVTIAYTDESES